MKLAINQPYFFPYLGYFQLIESVDKIILYEHVQYTKRSWITRNRLLNCGSGEAFYICLPVRKGRLISDVQLIEKERKKWERQFLNLVYYNYKKASYFQEVYEWLAKAIGDVETIQLHQFNSLIICQICNFLGIKTSIQFNNEKLIELEDNLHLNEKHGDIKVQRIIRICQAEEANQYINLPGGQQLYDTSSFQPYNIRLQFLQLPNYQYPQFQHDFVPHLSIIDVLIHNGKEGTKQLIDNYKLIG